MEQTKKELDMVVETLMIMTKVDKKHDIEIKDLKKKLEEERNKEINLENEFKNLKNALKDLKGDLTNIKNVFNDLKKDNDEMIRILDEDHQRCFLCDKILRKVMQSHTFPVRNSPDGRYYECYYCTECYDIALKKLQKINEAKYGTK